MDWLKGNAERGGGGGERSSVAPRTPRRRDRPRSSDLGLPLAGGPRRVVARNGKGLVFIDIDGVWAFEAAGRLTFVHSHVGKLDLDVTLAKLERSLLHGFTRVHRKWLINVRLVRTFERDGGEVQVFVGPQPGSGGIRVPVARSHAGAVRDLLLRNTTGIRIPRRGSARGGRSASRSRRRLALPTKPPPAR